MCGTGSIVRSDCSGDSSTTCKPCPSGTFMNEPNGLHNCFPCKNCAEDQGLYMQSKCTTMHDSICDVLDDHYCIDLSNQQCSHAVKHSVCKAGQETKTKGTKTTDTVCVDCAPGFYSSSGIPCIKWTNCTAINEIQTGHGSSVKDVTCTPKSRERYGLISGFILAVVVTILYLISPFWFPPKNLKRQKSLTRAVQETGHSNT
ncbi:tumor necrosis factor receptor superfamily member 14-like isoform X2 [Danio aesculapii]|nr:tumor necrosis factor receptor superfamily member 14-like isoform X2 [Danio aesculapii]